jgi:hypothetical protein
MTKIDNPVQFIAFTSLNQAEFMDLLQFFAPLCDQYYQYHDFKCQSRSMSRVKERSDVVYAEQLISYFLFFLI